MALSIKAELNRDTIPGRFVLTGSTRYTVLQRQTSRARTSWFADYVDLVVMRDVLDIARIRQREALPRLLRQFAAQTGQLLNITKAGQAVGLESSTANRYATLLEAAWLLGLSAAKINSRDAAALTEFGHLVEMFAVGEILKQVSWADEVVTASITANGREARGTGHYATVPLRSCSAQAWLTSAVSCSTGRPQPSPHSSAMQYRRPSGSSITLAAYPDLSTTSSTFWATHSGPACPVRRMRARSMNVTVAAATSDPGISTPQSPRASGRASCTSRGSSPWSPAR
jgi:hypothetical protein